MSEAGGLGGGRGEGEGEGKQAELRPARELHPLPRGLVELYSLLAVLVVLVPEWMAAGALLGLEQPGKGKSLPPAAQVWQKLPELRLASMDLAELRQLAARLRLRHYGRLDRQQLSARLLKRLNRRKALW